MCAVKMQKKLSFAFVLIMNEAMQMYKSLQYQQLYDVRSKYWILIQPWWLGGRAVV